MKKGDVKQTNEETDEKIAECVQGGDAALYDVLAERYRARLIRYMRRFSLSEDEASDVVQDALIRGHKGIQTFDVSKKFSPWIYRITHNEAMTYLKKRGKKMTVSLEEKMLYDHAARDVETASLESWFRDELRDEMRDAIAALPEQYREIIHLRYIEDLSYQEISDRVGKPVNTVGTLVRRAKKKLLTIVLASEGF